MRPTVQLSRYDNSWFNPGASVLKRTVWFFLGQPVLRCSLLPSSTLRISLLRLFGARIGSRVTMHNPVQVKCPWHLVIGDDCWIGEHVWIDNLTTVSLGSNVCVSQGAYICTGNHDWTDPRFRLIVEPVQLQEGSWLGAKAMLAPGAVLGRGSVAAAGAVIIGCVPDFEVYAGNPAKFSRRRVIKSQTSSQEWTKESRQDEQVTL